MTDDELLHTLLDVERAGWDSLCDCTGSHFYGRLMLPEAVMVLADGTVMDRDAVVEALSQSPPWRTYELRDARLVGIGGATAALVYTGVGYRDENDSAFVGAMSSVYHHTGGDWRLALYQQTPVPA